MWSKLFGCRDELPECSRSIERAVEAGRSSFHIGPFRARIAFADPLGYCAPGGSAFSSHLPRIPIPRTSVNKPSRMHWASSGGTMAAQERRS
jgi:hypothetical protein